MKQMLSSKAHVVSATDNQGPEVHSSNSTATAPNYGFVQCRARYGEIGVIHLFMPSLSSLALPNSPVTIHRNLQLMK